MKQMVEILKNNSKCVECDKELAKFTFAVVYDDFVVCVECNEREDQSWLEFQESLANGEI